LFNSGPQGQIRSVKLFLRQKVRRLRASHILCFLRAAQKQLLEQPWSIQHHFHRLAGKSAAVILKIVFADDGDFEYSICLFFVND